MFEYVCNVRQVGFIESDDLLMERARSGRDISWNTALEVADLLVIEITLFLVLVWSNGRIGKEL